MQSHITVQAPGTAFFSIVCSSRFVIYSNLNTKSVTEATIAFAIIFLGCSQPSIFSYFYRFVERVERIARELDANAKRES